MATEDIEKLRRDLKDLLNRVLTLGNNADLSATDRIALDNAKVTLDKHIALALSYGEELKHAQKAVEAVIHKHNL